MAAVDDPRFEACLPLILKEEGGNNDDPQDHGGRTSRGITQREYSVWRVKHALPERDVWLATDAEVRQIYFEEYWLLRGPRLHPGVDLVFFNFAVNAGHGEAHKLLLRSIGGSDADTVNRMCNAGEVFYRGLAQFPRYGRGWTARTERIRATALKMVAVAPVPPPQPKPEKETPPMTAPTFDLATIENDVNIGLDMLEKIMPFLSLIVGPQVALGITAFDKAVRAVETAVGTGAGPALAEAVSHVTQGMPNSAALGPTAG